MHAITTSAELFRGFPLCFSVKLCCQIRKRNSEPEIRFSGL